MKSILLAVCFVLFVCPCLAQQNQKISTLDESKVIIDATNPATYISFERSGKRPPPGDDVSDRAVWLRLHNNMRYPIKFCAFSQIDDKGTILTDELGIYYEVELTNPRQFSGKLSDVPSGNKRVGICHVYTLDAGESEVFSVPAEHLLKGLSIKIRFNYGWEEETKNNPIHFVYFNSLSIPK